MPQEDIKKSEKSAEGAVSEGTTEATEAEETPEPLNREQRRALKKGKKIDDKAAPGFTGGGSKVRSQQSQGSGSKFTRRKV